jgi:energy-coupling factor transporter ATP-binding protein EcfA2
MTAQWAQQFTTDTDFLKETQQIIQNLPPIESLKTQPEETTSETNNIQQTWEEITLTEDFKEKFNYLEFSYLEPFNQNSTFLECLNLIHLSTPIFTFLMFLFFILLPIFLMLYSSTPFSLDAYVFHLATLAKVSFMGKMAKSAVFNGWYHYQTLGMVVGCLLFYGVQFYNSYISYFRFWRNVELVNQHLITVRTFVQATLPKMKAFIQTCQSSAAKTYQKFCQITQGHIQTLESILHWLQYVQPYSYSIAKCYDFGNMFQCYYEFHNNRDFDASIRYATGFQGFWENIQVLQTRLSQQTVACASFPTLEELHALENISHPPVIEMKSNGDDNIDADEEEDEDDQTVVSSTSITEQKEKGTEKTEKKKKPKRIDNVLYGMYYPAHQKEEAVRNDCNLAENWIITGPNASGKTTYLKTVALNLIFTQQFGMGFYNHCVLYHPYTQFYTYLNIPDTSDRDSLFQAEVRRGKEILDALKTQEISEEEGSHTHNTFLLMDELFSGTNHDDAVQAAYAFLCYLGHPSRQQAMRFLLTTHFVEICDKIESTAPHVAQNGKMVIEEMGENVQEEEIRYLYQFKEGISRLRCGIHILKQMNYPTEVMDYLKTTSILSV